LQSRLFGHVAHIRWQMIMRMTAGLIMILQTGSLQLNEIDSIDSLIFLMNGYVFCVLDMLVFHACFAFTII